MGVWDLVAGDDHGHPLAHEGLLLRLADRAGDRHEVAGQVVQVAAGGRHVDESEQRRLELLVL